MREGGEEHGGADVAPQTARANIPPFSTFFEGTDGVLIFQISTETTVENQSYAGESVTAEGNADGKFGASVELRPAHRSRC